MPKKIALIGHCGPDSSYLRAAIKQAEKDSRILSADDEAELGHVLEETPDLLLLNRELGGGFADPLGVSLVKRLRASHPGLKLMLVSNYVDSQTAAVQAGALPGFGKREIGTPRVIKLLKDAIGVGE